MSFLHQRNTELALDHGRLCRSKQGLLLHPLQQSVVGGCHSLSSFWHLIAWACLDGWDLFFIFYICILNIRRRLLKNLWWSHQLHRVSKINWTSNNEAASQLHLSTLAHTHDSSNTADAKDRLENEALKVPRLLFPTAQQLLNYWGLCRYLWRIQQRSPVWSGVAGWRERLAKLSHSNASKHLASVIISIPWTYCCYIQCIISLQILQVCTYHLFSMEHCGNKTVQCLWYYIECSALIVLSTEECC